MRRQDCARYCSASAEARCGLWKPQQIARGTDKADSWRKFCARNDNLLRSRQKIHARAAGRAGLHGELCLENLFEQIALVDISRRANAQAFAALQQNDLVSVFASEIQFVGDDDDGVAIFRGEAAKSLEKVDLCADVEMQGGLVKKKKERLLSESASENDALFFAAGDLIHPAVAEIFGADLGEGVLGDGDIFVRFEAQRFAVRMTTLQDEFPGLRREEQLAFLLDHGDALAASARLELMGDETVEKNAAGKRLDCAGNNLKKSGFAAGVGAENSNDFARFGLEAGGFECEDRRLLGIRRISVADLFDAEACVIGIACWLTGGAIAGFYGGGHANLRRSK